MRNVFKWDHLRSQLLDMGAAVLAYSGGVDSSVLLRVAADTIGKKLIAVIAVSETYPPSEAENARTFAALLGVPYRILETRELHKEVFVRNTTERCYHCKQELFESIRRLADAEGIPHIIDGSNWDDRRDYRPGRRAAADYSVRSPLAESGITKQEIREFARSLGLPMWDKPSLACLSSRIPYGTRITQQLLTTIQSAEDIVRGLGIRQVRVRHQGDTARIEIMPEDFAALTADDARRRIVSALKALGYTYVCLDLQGYRTGSMNENVTAARGKGGERRGTGFSPER